MTEPRVWVFFYGSYMNRGVLAEVGLAPEEWHVVSLPGFDIRIAPRANLVRSPEHTVYGVLTTASHAELDRLYAHARDVLGERYLPEAVLVRDRADTWRPALCYIAPHMVTQSPNPAYVDRILAAARELQLPPWYQERLRAPRS